MLAGTKTRYFSNFNAKAAKMMSPDNTASEGSWSTPFEITNAAIRPERAPVGPTMLKLLPPNIAAIKPAHIAVIIPTTGVVCDATASETDNGIDTKATVSPAFQLVFIDFEYSLNILSPKYKRIVYTCMSMISILLPFEKKLYSVFMFLDLGIGIIITFLVTHLFGVTFDISTLLVGLCFVLIPDIDFLPHVFVNKGVNGTKWNIHRELTHYPILHLPVLLTVLVLFGNFYGFLYLVSVLFHFVHDSLWTGWGIKWLWPFSKRNFKFLADATGKVSWNPVISWSPEELKVTEATYGDKDWFKHLYLRPSKLLITEVSFFILGLLVLLLAF